MKFGTAFFSGAAAILLLSASAESQVTAPFSYADLADLALSAPVVAHVRLVKASALKPAESQGLRPGFTRFYVEADVVSLIRSAQGLPARIRYLADLPNDGRGKAAKPRKKSEYLVLAAPVAGRPAEVQLVARDAQIPFGPAEADTIRSMLREVAAPNSAPRITGIGKAFHVPGSLPGESETQIFLQTANSEPVSLSILRRPGATPQWAVALSEIIDDSAAEPKRDSLLWYRLACGLPARLPAASLSESEPEHRTQIEADYRFVMDRLGPCGRTRR